MRPGLPGGKLLHSPSRGESGAVEGIFHPVTQTSSNMLSERRTRALRDLTARTAKARTSESQFLMSEFAGTFEKEQRHWGKVSLTTI